MRNGSAAIVPLFLAMVLLFWYIAFMGGEAENLHATNDVTKVQKVQQKLLLSAVKYRDGIVIEAQREGAPLTQAEVDLAVDEYIKYIMVQNGIEK